MIDKIYHAEDRTLHRPAEIHQDTIRNVLKPSDLILNIMQLESPLSWVEIFGNNHPLEIEIGFGKGGFLVQSCQSFPEKNFLGIETAAKMAEYTAERLAKRNLTNARLLRADAHYVLLRFVVSESVSAVHIYFPDPWPKKRHRKRRLFQVEFLYTLLKILKPEGHVYFATDFQEYFEEVQELFEKFPKFISLDPTDWVNSRPDKAITNYETKYRREGRPIYYALYRKDRF